MKVHPLLIQVRALLAEKKWHELKQLAEKLDASEIASLFGGLAAAEATLLYRSLPRDLAADVFSFLSDGSQQLLLREMTELETRGLLAGLSPDDRTELFEELPAVATQRLLNLLAAEDRKEALMLLGYPKDSVGRLMSPDFATVRPEQTVAEAIDSIRLQAPESETIHMIYVVDAEGHLLDDLRLRWLILAEPSRPISDLMAGQPVALNAFDPEGTAVRVMKETGYFALPVVDSDQVLLGVVTVDDVLDLAVEEATEDIHKGGAMTPLETNLLTARFTALYSRRIAWLLVLVFVNIFTGAGIAHYEELIESVVALVFFLPLLIDSGGNAGAQASTLVIRSMALGDVKPRDYLALFWKETRVAMGLGATMAVAVSIIAYFRAGPDVAVVVSISMIAIVAIGSLVGMSLPFILGKIGMDPAAASGPLVTSVADILGVLIYLGIASAMLGVG